MDATSRKIMKMLVYDDEKEDVDGEILTFFLLSLCDDAECVDVKVSLLGMLYLALVWGVPLMGIFQRDHWDLRRHRSPYFRLYRPRLGKIRSDTCGNSKFNGLGGFHGGRRVRLGVVLSRWSSFAILPGSYDISCYVDSYVSWSPWASNGSNEGFSTSSEVLPWFVLAFE